MKNNKPGKLALITGINGFVGSHLAEACIKRGWEVHGTIRGHRSKLDHIEHLPELRLHQCDICDLSSISAVVRAVKPDYIFHLAAQSFVPDSWSAPHQTFDTNAAGTLNLLEAIRHECPAASLQFAGTSEEYGMVRPDEVPITEDSPLRPMSPYGVSKVAGDLFVRQYVHSYHLRAMVTRSFNHEGPRRGDVFAPSDWCKQVAEAEAGMREPIIYHGNLEAIRDYADVRDIVLGYIAVMEKGKAGEVYQLCFGEEGSYTMAEVLRRIIKLSDIFIGAKPDSKRFRPSDVPRLVGNYDKAKLELGWSPVIKLDRTLRDTLSYWRNEVV